MQTRRRATLPVVCSRMEFRDFAVRAGMTEHNTLKRYFTLCVILLSLFFVCSIKPSYAKEHEKENVSEKPLDLSLLKKNNNICFDLQWNMKIDDIEKIFKKKPSINSNNNLFLFEDVRIEGFAYPPFQVTISTTDNGNLEFIQFSFEFTKENLKNSRGEFDFIEMCKIRRHFVEYFLIKYRFIKSIEREDADGSYESHIFKQANYLIEFRTVTQKQKALFIVEYTKAFRDLGF